MHGSIYRDAYKPTGQSSRQGCQRRDGLFLRFIQLADRFTVHLRGDDADDFRRGSASGTGEGVLVLCGGKGGVDHRMRSDLTRIVQIAVVADNLRHIRRGAACQRGLIAIGGGQLRVISFPGLLAGAFLRLGDPFLRQLGLTCVDGANLSLGARNIRHLITNLANQLGLLARVADNQRAVRDRRVGGGGVVAFVVPAGQQAVGHAPQICPTWSLTKNGLLIL